MPKDAGTTVRYDCEEVRGHPVSSHRASTGMLSDGRAENGAQTPRDLPTRPHGRARELPCAQNPTVPGIAHLAHSPVVSDRSTGHVPDRAIQVPWGRINDQRFLRDFQEKSRWRSQSLRAGTGRRSGSPPRQMSLPVDTTPSAGKKMWVRANTVHLRRIKQAPH